MTLQYDFEHLCEVLDRASELPPDQAYLLLVEEGSRMPLDDELKVWWLVAARFALERSGLRLQHGLSG